MAVLGLNNSVHQLIFKTFLPADNLGIERQYLLAYFRNESALDVFKFKPAELSHIEDIKEVLAQAQTFYLYIVLVFILWQIIEWKQKRSHWLALWKGQLTYSIILWPLIALIFILGFQPLFIFFHQVAFPKGNWLFDPATDLIIQLYPPQFFYYFIMVWVTLTEFILLLGYVLIRLVSKRILE